MVRLVSVLLAALAFAPTRAVLADEGSERHDGFYLRLTTGVGYLYAHASGSGLTETVSGVSAVTTLGIGAALTDNLVLNADLYGANPVSPKVTVELGGQSASGDLKGDFMAIGLGLGVTYYVMPTNLYLGASVGPAWLSIDLDNGPEGRSRTGFGLNAVVGKEWWVSANWGLGVAAQVFYQRIPDDGATWNTMAGGVLFSATYN